MGFNKFSGKTKTRPPRSSAAARSIAAGSDCNSQPEGSKRDNGGQMIFQESRGPAASDFLDKHEVWGCWIIHRIDCEGGDQIATHIHWKSRSGPRFDGPKHNMSKNGKP